MVSVVTRCSPAQWLDRVLHCRDAEFLDARCALVAFLYGNGQRAEAEGQWEALQQAQGGSCGEVPALACMPKLCCGFTLHKGVWIQAGQLYLDCRSKCRISCVRCGSTEL